MPRCVVVASGHLVSPPVRRESVRVLHLPAASPRDPTPKPLQWHSRAATATAATTTTTTTTTLPGTATVTRSTRGVGLRAQYLSCENG